jgi:hypothetical protein
MGRKNTRIKVFVFQTEGTVKYNPGLESILTFLVEAGYDVWYWYLRSEELSCPEFSIFKAKKLAFLFRKFLAAASRWRIPCFLASRITAILVGSPARISVGVDRNGMILADRYSAVNGIPKAFFSYEIYFNDEVGCDYKREEIDACQNLSFAICQDPVRSAALSRENHIPPSLIINMPVAPLEISNPSYQPGRSREILGIKQEYVAVFAGSFAQWTMIDDLLDILERWPSNWAFVLRGRVARDDQIKFAKAASYPFTYFQDTDDQDVNAYHSLLRDADVGFAFYKEVPHTLSSGKNISLIGLSSGKISTYLSQSLPVICNEIGLYNEFLAEYQAGCSVDSVEQVPGLLQGFNHASLQQMKQNAYRLYREKLSPLLYRAKILQQFQIATESSAA